MRYLPVLLLLAACSLGSGPERTLYRLSPEAVLPPAHGQGHGRGILEVPQPTAEPDLDNDAIEVETGGRVSQVDSAAWSQPLPIMLQSLITGTLGRSGRYASVVDEDSAVVHARRLEVNIERFTLVLGNAPHVEVALKADFVEPASGKLVKSARLSASEPIEAVRMHFIIPAFERALARCLLSLEKMAK